jgi:fermentation-respiration switch protein FrsA (DUF1100 family)
MAFLRGRIDDYMQKEHNDPKLKALQVSMREGVKWYLAHPKQSVYIESHDGLKLHAEYIRSDLPSDKIIILFHGYRSMARNDFCCAMPYYNSLGLDILLVDQRAHGLSEGKLITFGVKERFDVCSWVKYIRENYGEDKKIYLSGMSMGSSTVMMASNIVDGVSGIIADCGFTSPKEIITIVAKKRFGLPKWCVVPIGLLARAFGKFDYSYSAKQSLAEAKAPILFIHGSSDDFVPCYMTEQAYEACVSKKEKVIVPEAPHGYSFLFSPNEVKSAIEDFILKR